MHPHVQRRDGGQPGRVPTRSAAGPSGLVCWMKRAA